MGRVEMVLRQLMMENKNKNPRAYGRKEPIN